MVCQVGYEERHDLAASISVEKNSLIGVKFLDIQDAPWIVEGENEERSERDGKKFGKASCLQIKLRRRISRRMMVSSRFDMKRELKRKREDDLVDVGVYVVFRRENGDSGRASTWCFWKDECWRFKVFNQVMSKHVRRRDERHDGHVCRRESSGCITERVPSGSTKTTDGNALKNNERKDRHAPNCIKVSYLSKSFYVGEVIRSGNSPLYID